MKEVIIIGGTRGIGRELAAALFRAGRAVAIAGRDAKRAEEAAAQLTSEFKNSNGVVRGIAADLARPDSLHQALGGIKEVGHLVLAGMVRDQNSLSDYNIDRALELVTVKLVGYTTAVHVLKPRFAPNGSILLFGGISKHTPYPGSTTMTAVNHAVDGLVTTFAREMAPVRVNSIHPGVVADSPMWATNEALLAQGRSRTILNRLPTMEDIVDGCLFLMNNPAATGISLNLDCGRV